MLSKLGPVRRIGPIRLARGIWKARRLQHRMIHDGTIDNPLAQLENPEYQAQLAEILKLLRPKPKRGHVAHADCAYEQPCDDCIRLARAGSLLDAHKYDYLDDEHNAPGN
jgi:hypothetical protein